MQSNFLNMFGNCMVQKILKFNIVELRSLFITCEFNIPEVIADYAFLWQLKNHYLVDTAIQLRGSCRSLQIDNLHNKLTFDLGKKNNIFYYS